VASRICRALFKDFSRSAGPPMIARAAAVVLSFYVAGAAQTAAAHYLAPAPVPAPAPLAHPRSRPAEHSGAGGDAAETSRSESEVPR